MSLHNDYSFGWPIPKGFRGFQSNCFGRIAELAQEYLAHCESIQAFLDAVVDLNSNKLVFAVSTFI